MQESPKHACPQEPQFRPSVCLSVQIPEHVSGFVAVQPQGPHWQLALQVCAPPLPQLCVDPGAHGPCPAHGDHADHIPVVPSHVRVCIPQLPQACDEGPVHVCPEQVASHEQLPPHVCVPPLPQVCLVLGAQTPSPAQADQLDHFPVPGSHVRVCVPHLPHACDEGPAQAWLPHAVHAHWAVQVCVPPLPHVWVELGAHAPSPVQADHRDQVPAWHVRVRFPQLPHVAVAGPTQVAVAASETSSPLSSGVASDLA
jgi:hypothetical protein